MDDGRERALSVDGDQGGLLVLIEPTPVTMPRHYATLRALPLHSGALKCLRFTIDWTDTCDNAVTGGEVCAYTLQVLHRP